MSKADDAAQRLDNAERAIREAFKVVTDAGLAVTGADPKDAAVSLADCLRAALALAERHRKNWHDEVGRSTKLLNVIGRNGRQILRLIDHRDRLAKALVPFAAQADILADPPPDVAPIGDAVPFRVCGSIAAISVGDCRNAAAALDAVNREARDAGGVTPD